MCHVSALTRPAWLALVVGAAAAAGCKSGLPQCHAPLPAAVAEAPKPPDPEYLLVEYRAGVEHRAPELQVKSTPLWESSRHQWKTVAVRMPDTCRDETAATATGQSLQSDRLLTTACGFYMAEIERALVEAGYRVVSWNALQLREREQKLSTYTAAKQLGADVVFMFNSLEASNVEARAMRGSSIRFYRADADGKPLSKAALLPKARDYYKQFVSTRLGLKDSKANKEVAALATTLDSTAVLAETGEAVWFYRKSETELVRSRVGSRFLFLKPPHADGFYPVRPANWVSSRDQQVQQAASEELLHFEEGGGAQDPYKEKRTELVRAVARDFVFQFRGGQQRPATPNSRPQPTSLLEKGPSR